MTNDTSFKSDAYCGLYCAACPNYRKTQSLAGQGRLSGRTTEPTDCKGCKSDLLCQSWCAHCNLKDCARSKGLEFCNQCAEYPCANLEGFKHDANYPYHFEITGYLTDIKAKGKDAWLADMAKRWSCASCGASHDWWTTKCPSCGKHVDGYVNPQAK